MRLTRGEQRRRLYTLVLISQARDSPSQNGSWCRKREVQDAGLFHDHRHEALSRFVLFQLMCGLDGCHAVTYDYIPSHDELATPGQRFSDHIVMQKQADDGREAPGQIGHNISPTTSTSSFPLFWIRSGSVETNKSVGIEIARQVKEALESVGYQITLAEAPYSDAPAYQYFEGPNQRILL